MVRLLQDHPKMSGGKGAPIVAVSYLSIFANSKGKTISLVQQGTQTAMNKNNAMTTTVKKS